MRDVRRSAVYAAEVAAFAETLADGPIGLEAVRTLAGMLFHHPWWVEATAGVAPRVVAARADARRSLASHSAEHGWEIRLAPCHLDATTLAHEAAHVLCGVHLAADPGARPGQPIDLAIAHGRAFRTAHLDVTEVVLGSHGRRLLADAYLQARLDTVVVAPWPTAPTELPFRDEHGLLGVWRTSIAL